MSGVADDVIVVIRDQYTSKDALRLAQIRLGMLLDKVLGIVVNDDHEMSSISRGADSRIAQTGVFQRRNQSTPSNTTIDEKTEVVVLDDH